MGMPSYDVFKVQLFNKENYGRDVWMIILQPFVLMLILRSRFVIIDYYIETKYINLPVYDYLSSMLLSEIS